MSELNDDLLNYEIGDVEADDTDLTGADEDELLLSDEETFPCKISEEQEENLLSGAKQQTSVKESKRINTDADVEQTSKSGENAPKSINEKRSSTEAKATKRAHMPSPSKQAAQKQYLSNVVKLDPSKQEEVSSTNKEDEENLSQSTIPTSDTTKMESNQSVCGPVKSVQETKSDSNDDLNNILTNAEPSEKSESIISESIAANSQETMSPQVTSEELSFDNGLTSDATDFEADDSDDVRERRNPKTCVERESVQMQEEENKLRTNNASHFQRTRNMRPSIPRQHHPYHMPPSENFNPSFMAQFRGQMPNRRPMPPGPPTEFLRNHSISMLRPGQIHRMPMHCMPPHPRLSSSAHQLGPNNGPHTGLPHRLQRPPFHPPPGMFGNNQGMLRPRVAVPNSHHLLPPRPPFSPFVQQANPGNIIIQRAPLHQTPPNMPNQNINSTGIMAQPPGMQVPAISRKVLLNPNFKGGVQAATNQLMMDTIKNSQFIENNREAELLRQQEAFINQNRMHIEKRRRSREYSPDRERSYSSPIRRRDHPRKPHPSYRENMNRGRRANSREKEFEPKRRRSGSLDGSSSDKKDQKTEEDEETRAYRLEIEKQKAMREKILRDKEMRRRRAAEDIKKDEVKFEKKVAEEPIQKLTPIIVTEKKIISLKKKATESLKSDSPGDQTQIKQPKPTVSVSKMQTVTESEITEKEATVRIKAVLKSSTENKSSKFIQGDNKDIDEDELLADSPQTPAVNASTKSKNLVRPDTDVGSTSVTASKISCSSGGILTNRRVVFRNSGDASNNDNLGDKSIALSIAAGSQHKGIFDRLDKKVISVNEAAKRKIQRIVINNSDNN